jgi:hypothetical protein
MKAGLVSREVLIGMRIEATVQIRRSPADVCAFVVDHDNDPRWCKKVKSAEPPGKRRWIVTHNPLPLRSPIILALEQLDAGPPGLLKLRQEDDASVST